MDSKCPICHSPARATIAAGEPVAYDCPRCGSFESQGHVDAELKSSPLTKRQIANIAGYLREYPNIVLSSETLPALRNLRTPTVGEKAIKLLHAIARMRPAPGVPFSITFGDSFERVQQEFEMSDIFETEDVTGNEGAPFTMHLLGAAYAEGAAELRYLLGVYLAEWQQLLFSEDDATYLILPKGWETIETNAPQVGRIAFVAMWFDPAMQKVFLEAIKPGIEDAGYSAFRVDQIEHNDDITDEILAGIRTSKFVIADFTGHRGGVYYEAGFASGLGKQVVKTVRADHATGIHFDIRQLNHIRWSEDNLPAFRTALTARIVGSIGLGPLVRES